MTRSKRRLPIPPDMELGRQSTAAILAGTVATLYAIVLYANAYGNALSDLYEWVGGKRILLRGAMMPYFSELLDGAFRGFLVAAAVPVALAALNYLSYRSGGSMSIYLMKRLPDRGLLHRQCLTLPLLVGLCYLLLAVILLGSFYLVYRYNTPAACLP